MNKATALSALALTLTLGAGPSWAQNTTGSSAPSVQSIIDHLKTRKGEGVTQGVHTRSLRLGAASEAVTAAKQPAAPASISVQVTFDFNSDRINGASAQTMSNLAKALASPALQDRRFRIIGHTDAVGSTAYNQALSRRRAASVKSYLMNHGVDAARLSTSGVGESDLLNKADPAAAENRRVVIEARSSG